jgi:RNA polymerase sigma-70 factor (ECF subfamily)
MQLLTVDQREALILVGPTGLTHAETAKICGYAVGTVKSRVSRARAALAAILEARSSGTRTRTNVSATQALNEIMRYAARLRGRSLAAQNPAESTRVAGSDVRRVGDVVTLKNTV